MKPCKIIELRAENVKKLSAVHIRPNGQSVVIGGDNDNGKSSVLDAIMYALCGERAICAEPLRRGQDKGESFVDLGDINVTRKFSKSGGTSLIVKSSDGRTMPSPQKVLDQIVGKLGFDPLAFMNMDAKAQRECLAKLAGIDFALINAEYQALYAERTEANREVQRLSALLQGRTETPGLPADEQLVEELMANLTAAQEHNKRVDQLQRDASFAASKAAHHGDLIAKQIDEIERLKQCLVTAEHTLESLRNAHTALLDKAIAAEMVANEATEQDEAPIKEAISAVGQVNAKIRANRELRADRAKYKQAAERWENLDHQCQATIERKKQLVTEAKFPLDGLSVTDDAVLFNDLPLKQASTSQQIKVSTSIAAALNPTLRAMFIREGSLLDLNTLETLHELAFMHDVQLFIERVSKGDEVSVIIEDGTVAADRLSAKP